MAKFYLSRFKDITKETFTVEVVTPMFLGGADKNSAELRGASIKGAIRFWWRAVYGGTFNSINEMYEEESKIFGSTKNKSTLVMRITQNKLSNPSNEKISNGNFDICEYLAYGYRNRNDIKGHIDNGTFKIELSCPKSYWKEVEKSFKCLIIYGGLGSKSRNGYGSLRFKNNTNIEMSLLKKGEIKVFTTFSQDSELYIDQNEYDTWQRALSEIGEAYKNAKAELKSKSLRRELIAKPFKNDKSRHAKPYFLHVNKLPNNKYKGQILFMPYNYSPNNNFDEEILEQYTMACNSMNAKIQDRLGGNR